MKRLLVLLTCIGCNGKDKDATVDPPVQSGPDDVVDTFTQTLISPIDILWAVDGGWQEGVDSLKDLEIFESALETVLIADPSWRMGVTSTNTTGGLFGIIGTKWDTYPPPSNAFAMPPSSSAPRVRDALYSALEERKELPQNAEFIRSDAHLYVIVYTDDEDTSSEVGSSDFNDWFDDFEPSKSKRLSVITSSDRKSYWEEKVIDGIVEDVGSFRKALENVLYDAMGQRTEFTLTREPKKIPEEITYIHREQETTLELGEDYTFDEDTLVISLMELIPQSGSQIVVEYKSLQKDRVTGDDDDDNSN